MSSTREEKAANTIGFIGIVGLSLLIAFTVYMGRRSSSPTETGVFSKKYLSISRALVFRRQ